MPMTDHQACYAAPGDGLTKFSDGEGLQLWISPAGGKVWKLAFRFDGRQKSLTIGPYPTTSLRHARQRKNDAKRKIAAGGDPSLTTQVDEISRRMSAENAFRVVAADLLERRRREGKSKLTLFMVGRIFGMASEAFGDRSIADVTAPEILKALRTVEARDYLEFAAWAACVVVALP